MDVNLVLQPLDREPFYHGFGPSCADPNLAFATWRLPVTDIKGNDGYVRFYITEGRGPLLQGNEVIHKSRLLGDQDLMIVPSSVVSTRQDQLLLPTYTDQSSPDIRTFLHVVPARTEHIGTFFSSYRALASSPMLVPDGEEVQSIYTDAKLARMFAVRFHTFTHLPSRDMKKICRRAKILTPALESALDSVVEQCTSCRRSGRPTHSKQVSFSRLVASFNTHVQADFFFIRELGNLPVLHIIDTATGLSETVLLMSREMETVARMIISRWIDIHGAPAELSADPEFDNAIIHRLCYDNSIKYSPRPARRHNKIGFVESGNAVIRILVQRLLMDWQHFRVTRNEARSDYEILSRATFLKNVRYGSKLVSSFELARGYRPALCGLPSTPLSAELLESFREQIARRALQAFLRSRNTKTLSKDLLPSRTPIYFFKREARNGACVLVFVHRADDNIVFVCSDPELKSKPMQVAYEDVRLRPETSLLRELDDIELAMFTVDREADVLERHHLNSVLEVQRENLERDPGHPLEEELPVGPNVRVGKFDETDVQPFGFADTDSDLFDNEFTLYVIHRSFTSMLSRKSATDVPSMDVGSVNRSVSKDIGHTRINKPPPFVRLESEEQAILTEIKRVVSKKPASERDLQFAPRWIIERSIAKEKAVYEKKDAFIRMSIRDIPRKDNVISSHHFFNVKFDGQEGKLRLKCRLVPHGNRDADKDSLRSDSSTAQFPCIRALLSLAALCHLRLSTSDINGAYLQSGELKRDVYMRPPASWRLRYDEVWKFVKAAYGLVESGRLWQLCIEEWLSDFGFETVAGLQQMFVLRRTDGSIKLLIAKVVDDLLIAGEPTDMKSFNVALSKRFEVGRYIEERKFMYNRLSVEQHDDFSVTISMQEYMDTITPIPISRERRTEQDAPVAAEERLEFLSRAGKMNYLGHGSLPFAAQASSKLQQLSSILRVKHLCSAKTTINLLRKLKPFLRYPAPSKPLDFHQLQQSSLCAFSDASPGSTSYGQSGIVMGILMPSGGGVDADLYHVLDWHSGKQGRVSFSSIGADILAASECADRAMYMGDCLSLIIDLNSKSHTNLVIAVDSFGLYSTITTLHEGREYRLRPTVSRLRDAFEAREITEVTWIPGSSNIADALTKTNMESAKMLNAVCNSGLLSHAISGSGKSHLRKRRLI